MLAEGILTFKQIAEMFDVSFQMIRVINDGEAWTDIEGVGSKIRTRKRGNVKLNETQVVEIRDLLVNRKLTFKQIAEMFDVSVFTIYSINKGKIWTHVEGIGSRIRTKTQ